MRPLTVKFWRHIGWAAANAIRSPGRVFSYNGIKFGVKGDFLLCRLLSGRLLYYYKPLFRKKRMPWGEEKDCIHFWGIDANTQKWTLVATYGGKVTENIVQAVSRDIMSHAMPLVENAGYPIVMHTHDELMSEVSKGFGEREWREKKQTWADPQFEGIMEIVPRWAHGLPLTAEGYVGQRYKK